MTALSLSLTAQADRRLEKVGDVVYLFDPEEGKPIYVVTANFGSVRGSVASPLTHQIIAESATLEGSTVNEPVRVEEGAVVRNSVLGPNVTVEAGCRVENSTVVDTILGSDSTVTDSTLRDSLVGNESRVHAYRGRLSVGEHSEVDGRE